MLIELCIIVYFSILTYVLVKSLKNGSCPSCLNRMSIRALVFFLFSIGVVSVLFYIRLKIPTDGVYFMFKSKSNVSVRYGIMFDAGSTGSRMHVFRFNVTKSDPLLILDDSLFVSIKPGLSSYAQSPLKAAQSIEPMLEKAKNYIPVEFWSTTPIALKATAGLRLLSEEIANLILSEVEKLFKAYPFKLAEDGVSILEGDEEGLFSWFTVNYLNSSLNNVLETFGVLDLGGGSTQITFYPTVPPASQEHVTQVELLEKPHQMYTHSYLGLGMLSARFQILGGDEKVSSGIKPQELSSPCLPSSYVGGWSYRGQNHSIRSTGESADRMQNCQAKSKEVIKRYNVKKPSTSKFFAISYFFDVAEEGGLIPDSKQGRVLELRSFQELTKTACNSSNLLTPFRCIDLCYITSLLMDGYGFPPSQPLVVKREIKDFEIAWPLGAMFDVFKKFNKVKS